MYASTGGTSHCSDCMHKVEFVGTYPNLLVQSCTIHHEHMQAKLKVVQHYSQCIQILLSKWGFGQASRVNLNVHTPTNASCARWGAWPKMCWGMPVGAHCAFCSIVGLAGLQTTSARVLAVFTAVAPGCAPGAAKWHGHR